MSLQQRHLLDLSEQDEGGDTTEQSATSDSLGKFASSSPPLRNTLRLLVSLDAIEQVQFT